MPLSPSHAGCELSVAGYDYTVGELYTVERKWEDVETLYGVKCLYRTALSMSTYCCHHSSFAAYSAGSAHQFSWHCLLTQLQNHTSSLECRGGYYVGHCGQLRKQDRRIRAAAFGTISGADTEDIHSHPDYRRWSHRTPVKASLKMTRKLLY